MDTRLPVVAIVGRPNVGKSTLFNRLIKQRKAIVGGRPGVTVDRLEAEWNLPERKLLLIDTGGIGETQHGDMQVAIDQQVEAALDVADMVLFVVDGIAGLTPVDEMIAGKLRQQQIPVLLVVNKAEKPGMEVEFHALGIGNPVAVSAIHGLGISELAEQADKCVPGFDAVADAGEPLARIAVIGRPNVGKSTLVNAWLGKDRMVVSPVAGTTRDSVDSDLPFKKGFIRLIDTAGQRKHARISDVIEFVSRVKAEQALRRAQAAVLLLDGAESIVEQDMRLLRLASEEGCAMLAAVNKADLLSAAQWKHYVERLDFRLRSLPDIAILRISAREKTGIKGLLQEAVKAAQRNGASFSTGQLNRWLAMAQAQHHSPNIRGAAVRLKYCTQLASYPPTIKVFCNRPNAITAQYRRYLEQHFRKAFKLPGVPVRFVFAATQNPYAGTSGKKRAG